jgi:lipoyl(octanoyl) transferase
VGHTKRQKTSAVYMKIVNLGLQDYRTTWEAMKAFTAKRQVDSEDELWIVERESHRRDAQ